MTGLERKYEIKRAGDNRDVDDGFVLRVTKDPAAWLAAWRYASLTQNEALCRDMREWLVENIPTDSSLGDEGYINRVLLVEIQQMTSRAA